MEKILLINPKIPSVPASSLAFPLPLLWIGSYLYENNYNVKIVNSINQKNYMDIIKREMMDSTCVGITAMTAQIPSAMHISDKIKEIDESIPIIWGGWHPTLYPEQTCKDSSVDITVTKDGEYPILNIIKYFEGKTELKDIKGITYKDGNNVKKNIDEKLFNLDDVEEMRWELLDRDILKMIKDGWSEILASKGCPFRCIFCVNTIIGNYPRFRNVDKVINDLRNLMKYKPKLIKFRDENFFTNLKYYENLFDKLIENNLELKWSANIRANYFRQLKSDIFKKAKKAGMEYPSIGAESGSQKILDILEKGITVNDLIISAKVTKEIDVTPIYSFMIGLPKEEKEDILKTVKLIDKLKKINKKTEIIGPQIFRPFPGSKLFNECLNYGLKEPKSLREWSDVVMNDIQYIPIKKFPWVNHPNYAETISFGTYWMKGINTPLKIKNPLYKILGLLYYFSTKMRWKTKFFKYPCEVKLRIIVNRYRNRN